MRALVTGASGFAGTHLVRHLLDCGDEVIGCIHPPRGDVLTVRHANYQECNLDITDSEQCALVLTKYRPEIVYHLAGIAFVPDAERDLDRVLRVNVAGFDNIARVCHQLESNVRVLLVSSGEVYGRITPQQLPICETTELRPHNNYSLSKLFAELVGERYSRAGKVAVVVARAFNHIGPGQENRFVAASFAEQIARIAAGVQEPRLFVGDLTARRDFSDVRDIVRGYRLAALRGTGPYNFGSGRSYSIRELVEELLSIAHVSPQIERDPSRLRPSEVPEIIASIEKAELELGWKPGIPFRQTLVDLYADAKRRVRPSEA